MNRIPLSVIICTHDPRIDYLRRVLDALAKQSYPMSLWELVIVDNASPTPVGQLIDLSWHPNSRICLEASLGIGFARVRGMREAVGGLHLHVDDDNVLDPSYLQTVVNLAGLWPKLGTFGAGCVTPEFEVNPESWAKPYLPMLALRDLDRERWSNSEEDADSIPFGAGMCVRGDLAGHFCVRFDEERLLQSFGAHGKGFTTNAEDIRGEDTLITFAGKDLGYGWGSFPQLKLVHLIPAWRTREAYLLKLVERQAKLGVVLPYVTRKQVVKPYGSTSTLIKRMYHNLRFLLSARFRERRAYEAQIRGLIAGHAAVQEQLGAPRY